MISSPSRDPRAAAAAALAALLLLLPLGGAWNVCLAAESVSLDVASVYASNAGTSIDPALSKLQGKLASMFQYSSYKLLDRKHRRLTEGDREEIELPDKRSMRIRLLSLDDRKVRLYVQIREKDKKLLGTTLGLPRGGMVMVGGPPHEAGVLIFIISAD